MLLVFVPSEGVIPFVMIATDELDAGEGGR
jgi:hypothetical protein